MYPRNAASPPSVLIGEVVQISDGAVQTTGVSVRVKTGSGAWGAGAGTLACDTTSGVWEYTPTQAETNGDTIKIAIYKSACLGASATLVTTAEATAGTVKLGAAQTTDITGSLSGSVGSVTGNVGGNVVGSVASVTAGVTLANTAHGGSAASLTLQTLTVSNSAGNAVVFESTGGSGHGLCATGDNGGSGIVAIGGSTGYGLLAEGGATTGHGAYFLAHGAGSYGALFYGGASGAAGAYFASSSAGPGIAADITGDLTGNVSGSVGSVTGNVGGSVVGSVASVTGGINTGAGTITTLDALDTAQDTQHSTTQSAISALNDPTAAAIADAVWDEATSGHATAGTTGKALTDVLADTNELQTNQGNWLTATGFSTHSAADVWSVATRVLTAATNITSDGSAITMSSSGVVGTVNLVNTTTTNTDMRGTDSAYTGTPPSVADIADGVWDEPLSGHSTAGTAGKALSDAGSAGDPWSTALPGAYGAGTAGFLVGTYIDAAISDTATAASVAALNDLSTADIDARLAAYDAPTKAELDAGFAALNDVSVTQVATAVWNAATADYGTAGTYGELLETNLDAAVSTAGGDSAATIWSYATRVLTAATNISGPVADAVWDEVASGHTTAGTTGKLLSDASAAGDPWSTTLPGAYGAGTAGYIVGTNLDAAVSGANTTTPPTAAAIADAVCDEALSGHTTAGTVGKAIADILEDTGTTLPAAISAIDVGAGSGARTITVTVNDGASALQGATVRLTEGVNTYSLATNASGQGTFNVDDATYTVAITKDGYTFAGASLTVTGDATPTYSMSTVAISPSAAADTVTAYGYTRDTELAIEVSQVVYFRLIAAPTGNGDILDGAEFSKTSDGTTGLVQLTMIKGGVYETRRAGQKWQQITIPTDAADPYELPNIL